jgi:enamine deaminase RidA (YjgF/YER057c/UK114 family)
VAAWKRRCDWVSDRTDLNPPMNIEANLRLLQLTLPDAPTPLGNYVPAVEAGGLLFVSGMLPMKDGAAMFLGRVGQELTMESGQRAAELAATNALAVARDAVGLNRLAGVLRLGVHVACASDFREHAAIADAASELLNRVFEGCRHSRLAFGNSSLPGGMPVELELIFLLHSKRKTFHRARSN